jgi:hypothetical protein
MNDQRFRLESACSTSSDTLGIVRLLFFSEAETPGRGLRRKRKMKEGTYRRESTAQPVGSDSSASNRSKMPFTNPIWIL